MKFKVGDRVAGYRVTNTFPSRVTGRVIEIDEVGDCRVSINENDSFWFHPKSLRRLVSVKRERVYVPKVGVCRGAELLETDIRKWLRLDPGKNSNYEEFVQVKRK